jgi:Leucine-rich repeat (LRR) protein
MKQILLILVVVALAGCGNKEAVEKPEPPKAAPEKPITDPVVEKEIRFLLKKPTGELTKADYEKVETLNLFNNKLTELPKGLEKLTKLEVLWLPNNQLTSVKELEKHTQLTNLDLSGNKLTDVKGLEKLTQLEYLTLTGNNLTSVKGLEKLTQLQKLFLVGNPGLTKAQIDELQKALPKCDISSNPTK